MLAAQPPAPALKLVFNQQAETCLTSLPFVFAGVNLAGSAPFLLFVPGYTPGVFLKLVLSVLISVISGEFLGFSAPSASSALQFLKFFAACDEFL